jgi:hypothetical protein
MLGKMHYPEADIMGERRALGDERTISRRELLRRARNALAVAALAATGYKLTEGISLNEPPLVLRTRSIEDMQQISKKDSNVGGRRALAVTPEGGLLLMAEGVRQLSEQNPEADEERFLTITPEGKLLFEPSGEFFSPGRVFRYVHRANDVEFIHKAHDMGANLFDIDANDVDGAVYAEHGIVPQVELRLGSLGINLHLPVVVDQNEMELKLGMPTYKYEQLVACVASLSTADHPLAVSTELKRGNFDRATLVEMLNIHQRHNVPVIMHPTDPHQLDTIGIETS